MGRQAGRARRRRREPDLEVEIEGAAGLVCVIEEVGQGGGIAFGPGGCGMRNGASASGVTIQGEIVVAKLLARNGPSGWYSQPWMSRADQSLSRQKPATCPAACSTGTGLPCWLPGPIHTPSSSS